MSKNNPWNVDLRDHIINALKRDYPAGTRVECLAMYDFQAVPSGTQGTVRCVDDIGTIHVNWDNGSTLGLVMGEDIYKKG